MPNTVERVKLQPNVMNGKVVNEDNSLTFENGDRFLYANAGAIPPLPERTVIGRHKVEFFIRISIINVTDAGNQIIKLRTSNDVQHI